MKEPKFHNYVWYILCLIILIISASAYASQDEKIPLICKWTTHNHNFESFIIDLKNKDVFWNEEEVFLKIDELNDGYIKFRGIKSSVNGKGGVPAQAVNVSFKINRIDGRFYVTSDKVKTDRVGMCEKSPKLF